MTLEDKTVIIVGGAQNIGFATAKQMAQQKANVVIADIKKDLGEGAAETLRQEGGQAIYIETDIRDEASVAHMVDETVARFGRLDMAVNGATLPSDERMLADMDEEELDEHFAVGLRGMALCMKYQVKQMLKQDTGGSIVNLSSMYAMRPQTISPIYIAAKRAVIGLTQNVALDYADKKIRVNALAPGVIGTKLLEDSINYFGIDPLEYASQLSMLGRFAKNEEIAEGITWLCSDEASFITAAVLPIEGGYLSM